MRDMFSAISNEAISAYVNSVTNTQIRNVLLQLLKDKLNLQSDPKDDDVLKSLGCTDEILFDILSGLEEELEIVIPKSEKFNCDMTVGQLFTYCEEICVETQSNESVYSWNSKEYLLAIKQLDALKTFVNDEISNEGIGTGLLKVFFSTVDVFGKVCNSFKTSVFKFYKSLKRSEMRYYYESNLTKVKYTEDQPFIKFMELDVTVPTGMSGSYENATTSLSGLYNALDLLSIAYEVNKTLVDIRRMITRNERYQDKINTLRNNINNRLTVVNTQLKSVNNVFTANNKIHSVKFKAVYASMQDFKSTRINLLNMEEYLSNTAKLINQIDEADAVLADITNYLTDDSELNKEFVSKLIDVVKFMATAYDYYGINVSRQMAVEHNHINSLTTAWKAIK